MTTKQTTPRSPGASAPRPRKRLSAEDRREDILLKAIDFFAVHGFAINTRELATHIGVTQPLLFRYFPSKADLVEAVFEEMYARQRRHEWDIGLSDRTRPVAERLIEFCSLYAERTYSYEWIRIYSFAGLLDGELNRRYIRRVTEPALRRICVEVGFEYGRQDRELKGRDARRTGHRLAATRRTVLLRNPQTRLWRESETIDGIRDP